MPPPSYCSKISTESANDHATDIDFNNSKSEISNFFEAHSGVNIQPSLKSDTLGFVKTLLGPSLEDAVLRTLEFGKTLIQKPDGIESISNEKQLLQSFKKKLPENPQKKLDLDFLLEKRNKIDKMKEDKSFDGRSLKKNTMINEKTEKSLAHSKKCHKPGKKLAKVSKIRSLDSDLKPDASSPEKIKRQLEALIQINKDVPFDHAPHWTFDSKTPKLPVDMTLMPTFCMFDNKPNVNCPSSCDAQSNSSKADGDGGPTTSKTQQNLKKRYPNKICQAPEFLSNALGPTLDVSIIDNIKMMRDILKCDSAKGEGSSKRPFYQQVTQEIQFQNSEAEMLTRVEELQKKIEELEEKERCLAKQIEDEERERECKKKTFEEEEKKMCSLKACLKQIASEKQPDCKSSIMECGLETKFETLQSRIACEEEKLSRLKAQSDNYRREIIDAKNKKETLKRNKSLLDAWDVFASRTCHTKLPSFSRVYCLDRKNFTAGDTGNLHCCFPVLNPPLAEVTKSLCGKQRSRSRCRSGKSDCHCLSIAPSKSGSQCFGKSESQCPSRSESRCRNQCEDICSNKKEQDKNESQTNIRCKIKMGEIQFPVQRDIFCGLHQMLKTCSCKRKENVKQESRSLSSEDELFKRCRAMKNGSQQENYYSSLCVDSSAEMMLKPPKEKIPCRSKSDTSLKRDKCSRIVKVMWATTRINIFQDNCRTYEIMDATSRPPSCIPVKTEGIFVVKTPQRKVCKSSSRRKCS